MISVKKIFWTVALVIISLWAITTLFPMFWMFQTAFTPEEDISTFPPRLIPSRLTLDNFRNLFESSLIWRWIGNSIFISVSVTVLSLLVCSMAAYAFAKLDFAGKKIMFTSIVATILVPAQVTLLPAFLIISKLNLIDTLWAIIIPSIASPYTIFMMRQYMITIPTDYIDAARIDGASEFGIYLRIILPMSKPVIGASAIFTFISIWNSFLWPLIVLNSAEKYPLTVGLATLQRQHLIQYGLQMAGAVIAALPMIIVFFAFQGYFMRGLMSGGTKG